MLTVNATVQTTNPPRIMKRLCKHWAHKLPVTVSSDQSKIELPMGVCKMRCTDTLMVTLKSEAAQMAKMQQVVSDHLQRMAGQKTLTIKWT